MALNSIFCADVPLRHYLLTHSLTSFLFCDVWQCNLLAKHIGV